MLRRSTLLLASSSMQHNRHPHASQHHPPARFHPLRLFGDPTCPFTHRCTIVAAHKRVPLEVLEVSNRNKPDWWDDFFTSSSSSSSSCGAGSGGGAAAAGDKSKLPHHQHDHHEETKQKTKKALTTNASCALDYSAPILQVGSRFIRDSKVISEYFDATYPPTYSLLPPMPHIRAHVRQFQSACADLIDAMYDYLHFNPKAKTMVTMKTTKHKNGAPRATFSSIPLSTTAMTQSVMQQGRGGTELDSFGDHIFIHHRHHHDNSNLGQSCATSQDTDEERQQQPPPLPREGDEENNNNNTTTPPVFLLNPQHDVITTTTTAGKARGRKKSVLASKIFHLQQQQQQLLSPQQGSSSSSSSSSSSNETSLLFLPYNVTEESLLRDLRYQLRRVESYLDHSASPFLLGGNPSLGDMTLIPFIDRFRFVLATFKKFYLLEEAPALGRLMQAAEMLSSFQRTRLGAQEYLESFDYLLEQSGEDESPSLSSCSSSFLPKSKCKVRRTLEIFTPPIVACPWSDAVRLTAALKNIHYDERPIRDFAKYEQRLLRNLRKNASNAAGYVTSFDEVEDQNLFQSGFESDNNNITDAYSNCNVNSTSCSSAQQQHASLLSNATGESVIIRPSSGLHPIRSALCACQYLVDAYSTSLIISRSTLLSSSKTGCDVVSESNFISPSLPSSTSDRRNFADSGLEQVFQEEEEEEEEEAVAKGEDGKGEQEEETAEKSESEEHAECEMGKRRERELGNLRIDLEIESHLDVAHQHYLINYLDKHFGPRLVAYLHEKMELQKKARNKKNSGCDDSLSSSIFEDQSATSQATMSTQILIYEKCKDRLQEAICVIARELRGTPYSVCSTLCLADVVICSFFAQLNLDELSLSISKETQRMDAKKKNSTNRMAAQQQQQEPEREEASDDATILPPYLLDDEMYEHLKRCLKMIRHTVHSGLKQSILNAEDAATKEKLEALRKRMIDG